jgi:histidinol-phosphate aminotransferase
MKDAVKLHLNELPFAPSRQVLQPLEQAIRSANKYPEWDGLTLRTALAQHMEVDPDWVVVGGAGSIGVIQQAMVAAGGGEVVYGWPSFEAFDLAAKALRMPIHHVNLKENACDLELLAKGITPETSIIIVCTPNAPTGGIVNNSDFAAFMEQVPDHIIVLIDEAYHEFVDHPDVVDSLKFVKKHPNVMLTRTFSKAYGLAGLRVGYAVAQPVLAERIASAGLPFPVPLPVQEAAIAALADQETLQQHIENVSTERHRLANKLRELGAEVIDGYANFVWLPVGELAEKVAAAFRKEGIWVKSVASHGVRITVGLPEDTNAVCEAWSNGGIASIAKQP